METRTVDARGLACPLPVVNTKKAAAEMKNGGELCVLVDNEIAVQNLQKFAKQKNYVSSAGKKADNEYEVIIEISVNDTLSVSDMEQQKGVMKEHSNSGTMGDKNGTIVPKMESCEPDSRRKGMVVVLSANVMGTGEEKLGKALMKAFVFALTKQDALPETIVCYNTGAYLTCEGADTLEDLKNLEAEGVTVLTCGTCLDFYGIKEKLAVGTVTNMYEIVETMENAKTLVRP